MQNVILLEDNINEGRNFNKLIINDLRNFCERNCAEFLDFIEILDEVKKFEIENKNYKIPKLTLQVIGVIYSQIKEFPISDFTIQTFTFNNFFESVYQIINVKLDVHHFHFTDCIHDTLTILVTRKLEKTKLFFLV